MTGLTIGRAYSSFKHYQREVVSDETLKRLASVALPAIAIYTQSRGTLLAALSYQACSKLDLEMSDSEMIQTAITVVEIIATIFAHPAGVLIHFGNDLVIHCQQLYEFKDAKQILESSLHIVGDALFFANFFAGSVPIGIAFYTVQTLKEIYNAADHFHNGRNIEGFGALAIAAIRLNQLAPLVRKKPMMTALPPWAQQAREQNAITEKLIDCHIIAPGDAIEFTKTATGYHVVAGGKTVVVQVTYLPPQNMGPIPFKLNIHYIQPSENGVYYGQIA